MNSPRSLAFIAFCSVPRQACEALQTVLATADSLQEEIVGEWLTLFIEFVERVAPTGNQLLKSDSLYIHHLSAFVRTASLLGEDYKSHRPGFIAFEPYSIAWFISPSFRRWYISRRNNFKLYCFLEALAHPPANTPFSACWLSDHVRSRHSSASSESDSDYEYDLARFFESVRSMNPD